MPRKSAVTKKKGSSKNSSSKKVVASKNLHIIPRVDGWVIVSEGSPKVTSVHNTQLEAIETARKVAKKSSGQLVVHGRNGRIREREHYSSDPLPPRESRKVLSPDTPPRTASREAISRAVSEAVRESGSNSRSGTAH